MNYLTPGPMMTIPERRQALVERMASDLIALGPFDNDDDAIEVMVGCHKYRPTDVMELFEAVKYAASQEVVAREMSNG